MDLLIMIIFALATVIWSLILIKEQGIKFRLIQIVVIFGAFWLLSIIIQDLYLLHQFLQTTQ